MNTSRKLQTDTHSIVLRPITREDIPRIARYTKLIDTRACDYTLGGIILWADYFDYRIAEANDTLHVHVEKADHTIPGSGETIAHLFAADRLRHNPSLTIINRQDDAGSPALQAAKLSWHPLRLLPKSLL